MTDNEDDGQATGNEIGLPRMPPWWEETAQEHAHRAMAYPVDLLSGTPAPPWSCNCDHCGWARREGWTPPALTEHELMNIYAADAYSAIMWLSRLRGTHAARKALDVASQGVSALTTPNNPENIAAVERMYLALVDVDGKRGGERQVIVEVQRAVMAVLGSHADAAVRRLRDDLAAIIERHEARVSVPDDATLAAVLARCEATMIKTLRAAASKPPTSGAAAREPPTSGAIARILHSMRWFGADPPETLEKVTKRVSETLRARRTRIGKHVVKPQKRKPKKRMIRRKSKAKRKVHA